MGLQIKYSKELAKEYGQIAVYLPGTTINVGDIITFDYGKNIFGKARPLGSFQKKSSLKELGVHYKESDFSKKPDPYYFKSNGTKIIDAGLNANSDLGNENLPQAKGSLGVQLSSEGSIFIMAIDCDSKNIENVFGLENEINANRKKMIWKDTFLVTSLTIAKKALVAQSKTSTSEFVISGDVNGIKSSSININADAKLSTKITNGNIFMMPWSDNVTLFMNVIRFEEKVFSNEIKTRNIEDSFQNDITEIKLRDINFEELLNN